MDTYKDPKKEIVVQCGDIFAISLAANPTTGYTWNVELDSNVIEKIDEKETLHMTGNIGGESSELFRFKACSSGSMILKFTYAREWLPDNPQDEKIFKLTVS